MLIGFSSVLITLYRLYLAQPQEEMITQEAVACRHHCLAKAKYAAADNSNQLSKLLAMNAIDQSPSSL